MSDQSLFARLLADLHEDATSHDILDRVVKVALQVIGCDGVACALWRDHAELHSAAITDDTARRAAMLQLELDDGPCMIAVRTTGQVRIDNITTDTRWPAWATGVAELGARSSISVALASNGPQSVGSLFLYARRVNAFDEEDASTAQILAAHAAVAVRQARHAAALERAIHTRTITGQATGIVMNRYAVTAEQAFAALIRSSQAANLKLRDVADGVVRVGDLPHGARPPANDEIHRPRASDVPVDRADQV